MGLFSSLRISTTFIPSLWFLFKSSIEILSVLSAFYSYFFSSPVIPFSFVFLLIRRKVLLLPSTMSLKELRKGLFISVVLIPFSYGCAQCLKWWEHLHVVSAYIYFDKLSRDEIWKLPYSTFLYVMSFQFQSSSAPSFSSSFPTVKLQSVLFIYFVKNKKFCSCFPRALVCGKDTITQRKAGGSPKGTLYEELRTSSCQAVLL